MQLYLLKRIAPAGPTDRTDGAVVRAASAADARKLVSEGSRDPEDKNDFLNPKKTTCRPFSEAGKRAVILRDVHAA